MEKSDDVHMKDPYLYFCEDFLAKYDKNLKKSRRGGCIRIPYSVVNFL